MSAWTRSSICCVVSASSVVAPRKARTAGGTGAIYLRDSADRQGEAHDSASAVTLLGPDAPAVTFDDLLADGEADTRARTALGCRAASEHREQGGSLVARDTRTVVAHGEHPVVVV